MKKTIEEAAEEYLLEGLSCMNEDESYSDIDIEEAFIAGHAYSLEQAQEEIDEKNAKIKELIHTNELYTDKIFELEEKMKGAVDCLLRLEKITVLAESAKYITREALETIRGGK